MLGRDGSMEEGWMGRTEQRPKPGFTLQTSLRPFPKLQRDGADTLFRGREVIPDLRLKPRQFWHVTPYFE